MYQHHCRFSRRAGGLGEDARGVSPEDLTRLVWREALSQHRGHQLGQAAIVLDGARRPLLVRPDAHVLHTHDVDQLADAVHVTLQRGEEMPERDDAPCFRDGAGVIRCHLAGRQGGLAHG